MFFLYLIIFAAYVGGYIFCISNVLTNMCKKQYESRAVVLLNVVVCLGYPLMGIAAGIYLGVTAFKEHPYSFSKMKDMYDSLPWRYDAKAHRVIDSL